MRILNLNLLLVGLLLCSGCTAMKSRLSQSALLSSVAKESVSESKPQQNETQAPALPDFQTPEKMLAVWKDSVRMEDNGVAMRGFGGRLYLYDADGKAIRAQGDVVVYGFDDSVTDRQGSKADRKIVISNQQLQRQYSESALGPSYSIWISWDRVGSIDKSVTLVPFFRPQDGKIVQGGQAIYALHTPGNKTDTLHKERISSFKQSPRSTNQMSNQVSQVSYQEVARDQGQASPDNSMQASSEASDPNVRTTTISLPRATQQRLRSSEFGTQGRNDFEKTIELPSATSEAISESKPSRIEEAREKRKQQIKEGNVFGMPGQL